MGIAEDDSPDTAGRIAHAGPGEELAFQVGKVHLVAAAGEPQRVGGDLAAAELDRGEERVVDGLLEDNFVAGAGQRPDGDVDGGDDAGGKDDPLRLYFPVEF